MYRLANCRSKDGPMERHAATLVRRTCDVKRADHRAGNGGD